MFTKNVFKADGDVPNRMCSVVEANNALFIQQMAACSKDLLVAKTKGFVVSENDYENYLKERGMRRSQTI